MRVFLIPVLGFGSFLLYGLQNLLSILIRGTSLFVAFAHHDNVAIHTFLERLIGQSAVRLISSI